MGWIGLLLLAAALALILSSGWPTYAVLLGVCTAGALCGLALGSFDAALLSSLPGRVLGLLEHDLLQALALYALIGALLNRMGLGDSLFGGLRRLIGTVAPRAAPELAGLGLGALMAPLNGSVGASLIAVAHSTSAHWSDAGLPAPRRAALIAVASTLGVAVPPSLVLLLLGDAMMRAHTEGLNLARTLGLPLADSALRIVNSQDVMQAALLPGLLMLSGWLALSALLSRASAMRTPTPWPRRERWAVLLVPTLIITMLVLIAVGRVRAVEAAAGASLLLLAWGLLSGALTRGVLRQVLDDAMSLTGTLFALLLAATTFSLLLRGFGTDRLVGNAMLSLQGQPALATAAVLALMLACAFVLDAFELIFLVVPIVMPPLLAQVGDAAWVAAMTLLVLQIGFLLPPFGYAFVLARARFSPRPALPRMAAALFPYLAWAAAVLALTALAPRTTHWLRSPEPESTRAPTNPEEVERLMREMSQPPDGQRSMP